MLHLSQIIHYIYKFLYLQPKRSEPDSIIIPLHSPDEVLAKDLPDMENADSRIVSLSGTAALNNRNNANINGKLTS